MEYLAKKKKTTTNKTSQRKVPMSIWVYLMIFHWNPDVPRYFPHGIGHNSQPKPRASIRPSIRVGWDIDGSIVLDTERSCHVNNAEWLRQVGPGDAWGTLAPCHLFLGLSWELGIWKLKSYETGSCVVVFVWEDWEAGKGPMKQRPELRFFDELSIVLKCQLAA